MWYWICLLTDGISLPLTLQVEAGLDALQLPQWSRWDGRTVHNAKRIKSLQRRYFKFLQCRGTCDSSWRKGPIHLSALYSVAIFICICFVFFPILSSVQGLVFPLLSCFWWKWMIRQSGTKNIALKVPTTSLSVVSRINENMKISWGMEAKKRKRQNLLGVVWCANVWLLSALTPEEFLLCQSRISNTSRQIWGKI